MKNPKKVVFGVIVLVAMLIATLFGNTLWGQDPLDSLRKASPKLAKFVPPAATPASFGESGSSSGGGGGSSY